MTEDDTQQSIVSNTPGADFDLALTTTESQVDAAPIFASLDLGTSSLLPAAPGASTVRGKASAYDPVAELLGLNTDSDSDNSADARDSKHKQMDKAVDGGSSARSTHPVAAMRNLLHTDDEEDKKDALVGKKAKSKRKPFSASMFALKQKAGKESVVGRLAAASAARRKKMGSSSEADSSGPDSDTDAGSSSNERAHADGSESAAVGSSQPGRSLRNLRIDSDSESDARSDTEAKQRDDPGQKDGGKAKGKRASKENIAKEPKMRKERAASKAAIALMHRETERLVRETAVKIEPLEFTKRLELEDFFARFSDFCMSRDAKPVVPIPVSAPIMPRKTEPRAPITFCYESDTEDFEIEIVDAVSADPPSIAAPDPMAVLSPKKPFSPTKGVGSTDKGGDDLDAILKYGSQPLHASARLSNASGVRRTDGPLALKELNGALLSAVYRKDKEAREAKEKKSRKKREKQQGAEVKTDNEQATADEAEEAEEAEGGEEMDVDGAQASASDDDSEDSEDSSDDDEDQEEVGESAEHLNTSFSGRRPRVVAASDDEGETSKNGGDAHSKPSQKAPAEAPAAPEPAASKSKFIGLFKMPTKPNPKPKQKPESPVRQPVSPPSQQQEQQQSPAASSSQRDPLADASQDLAYMFTSQIDQINTQDSLLMTPSQMSQFDNTFSMSMATQAQRIDMDTVDMPTQAQSTQPTQPLVEPTQFSMGITQPTQRMADQPTQSTQPTQSMTDAGIASTDTDTVAIAGEDDDGLMSVLPTMVRRALNPETERSDPAVAPVLEHQRKQETEQEQEPARRRRTGKLVRRNGDDGARKGSAKAKRKKQMLRSEFIEAEAEVGESSDSDGEGGAQPGGKFSWAEGEQSKSKPEVSSDEEDLDMDSDEEAEALLADPMIDNEVSEDSEDEQAVRALHRKQDFDQDERDIQELARDIATGNLRNRGSRNRTAFELGAEENYIDRQDRAERMEERLRLRRKLEAREIHDTNLAAIAKNPETAAFARAALMRPPPLASGYQSGSDGDDLQLDLNRAGNGSGDDDDDDDAFALEEVVDDHSVAAAIEQQLAHGIRRSDSDAESESEASTRNSRVRQRPAVTRIAGSLGRSLSTNLSGLGSSASVGDDIDGDLFTPVSVEKLIIRRSTLLKRPGAPLASGIDPKRRISK